MVGKLLRAFGFATVTLLALTLVWAAWAYTGRAGGRMVSPPAATDIPTVEMSALGQDNDHGNLLAVQPWVTTSDYASADALRKKFSGYLAMAEEKRWLKTSTIAVFPEYSGTWLVAAGEKESAIHAQTIESAMTTVALTHLPEFAYRLLTAPAVQDPSRWALFTVKAERMAQDYQAVFGELAKRYGIRIVAGSIVLPSPRLVDGKLQVQPGGEMRNVSALFGPDGRIIPPLVVKSRPIDEEQTFSGAGNTQDIPVFDTPAGKLGVLICADSWYPAAYANLKAQGASLIAVPSYSSGNGIWQSTWMGYNGAPTEGDVDKADLGRLTEGQAWLKYAMAGRAPAAGLRQGVNVFLRGDLWDLGSDGATVALQDGKPQVGALQPQAALTNLWLR